MGAIVKMNHHKEEWELEKDRILLQKKKHRLLESLSTYNSRKGWIDRGPVFSEGEYFVHPSTKEVWLATGSYSPTWGTEVQIYSASIGRQLEEWEDRLKALEAVYDFSR